MAEVSLCPQMVIIFVTLHPCQNEISAIIYSPTPADGTARYTSVDEQPS